MSRTSKALKRLGVAGVAVATIGAGVPAFFATAASAANSNVTGVSLSPDADSAPTGTCNQFTATVTFNTAGDTATLDVQAAPRAADQNVDFCDVTTDGRTVTAPGGTSTAVGGAGAVEKREYVVTAAAGSTTGTVTFGVISAQAGVVDVTAFVEGASGSTGTINNAPDGNEPKDTSVKTFTAGGGAAVSALDAEPESAVNVQGDTHVFTAKLTQSDGQPVPGVTAPTSVKFFVTAGPDASQTPAGAPKVCNAAPQTGTTDQKGEVSCSLTNTGGPGTDTIVVFFDRDNDGINDGAATEPQDEISKTFQAPQAAGTTVELTCDSVRTNTAGDACVNPVSEKTEKFTATVKSAGGTPVAGAAVQFAITGQTGDNNAPDPAAGTTANPDVESISPTSCTTDANGQCSTTVTNPRVAEDETVTIRARIVTGPGSINVDDSATKTWRTPTGNEARNINLTPDTQSTSVGNVATVLATVLDRLGNPVKGVSVKFTENGTGRFTNGSDTFFGVTDAKGEVRAELTTQSNEAAGSTTVTASIEGFDTDRNGTIDAGRGTGTSDDECEKAATATTSPAGNAPGQTAGNCSDTANVTFGGASPSATPTATTSPGCKIVTTTVNTKTVNATGLASVTVSGATSGATIELQGYSQNHYGTANFNNDTTNPDRTGVANTSGSVTFNDLRPGSNTRLRARQVGCAYGNSDVINVRTQLSLQVTRTAPRTYRFNVDSIPARPGGLIVSIYRITGSPCAAGVEPRNCPGEVFVGQTRVSSTNGAGSVILTFGKDYPAREQFVLKTGQDAQNAPGRSNVRDLAIF